MSYEIIKSIKIDMKKKEVYIISVSNNVFPRCFYTWKCDTLTDILRKKGREALDIEILKCYECGHFQRGNNKYEKAMKILEYVYDNDEYNKYNWENRYKYKYTSDEYDELQKLRRSQDFCNLLLKAFNTKIKNKYYGFINTSFYGGKGYLKKTKNSLKIVYEKKKATKFLFEKEIKNLQKYFVDKEIDIQVEKI